MNEVIYEDVLPLCLSQSFGGGSLLQLEECLNKLMAIQEIMSIEEGNEPSLLDVLGRVIGFYERFVPISTYVNGCRLKIGG